MSTSLSGQAGFIPPTIAVEKIPVIAPARCSGRIIRFVAVHQVTDESR